MRQQQRSLLSSLGFSYSIAIAPLGGASPQVVEGASESEESPTATDCTSLTLVDSSESQSASLIDKKQDSGDELKDPHEDKLSAAPLAQNEKWSSEAIAKRMELRPSRENKLRLASLSGDNPGFEYLQECWEDVALWNRIKQMIAQYPEWGIACVEGRLVDG